MSCIFNYSCTKWGDVLWFTTNRLHCNTFNLFSFQQPRSIRKVYVDLYSAFLRKAPQMRSDMDHTVFTCKLHHVCLYSPAAEHHRPLPGTHFTVPRKVEGWVDLGGWLHIEIKCRPRESNPDMVTHPSTNQVRHRLTSLIETSALPPPHVLVVTHKSSEHN